jgi:thiamine pyrophosphate-dependent acetolactate synthase large subunit-like protein
MCNAGLLDISADKDRRLIGSLHSGSMANALWQSIGANLRLSRRQVVAMAATADLPEHGGYIDDHAIRSPNKLMVFNNGALECKVEMEVASRLSNGLEESNFAKLAEAIGIMGSTNENPADAPRESRSAHILVGTH